MSLGEKHADLLRAQEEVRRLSTEAERERIARDLHDLLGRTLTLIALKADLAVKLSARNPAAAEREMKDVADAARGGLSDVRAALAGRTTRAWRASWRRREPRSRRPGSGTRSRAKASPTAPRTAPSWRWRCARPSPTSFATRARRIAESLSTTKTEP
jgi:hypothetical protein